MYTYLKICFLQKVDLKKYFFYRIIKTRRIQKRRYLKTPIKKQTKSQTKSWQGPCPEAKWGSKHLRFFHESNKKAKALKIPTIS